MYIIQLDLHVKYKAGQISASPVAPTKNFNLVLPLKWKYIYVYSETGEGEVDQILTFIPQWIDRHVNRRPCLTVFRVFCLIHGSCG